MYVPLRQRTVDVVELIVSLTLLKPPPTVTHSYTLHTEGSMGRPIEFVTAGGVTPKPTHASVLVYVPATQAGYQTHAPAYLTVCSRFIRLDILDLPLPDRDKGSGIFYLAIRRDALGHPSRKRGPSAHARKLLKPNLGNPHSDRSVRDPINLYD